MPDIVRPDDKNRAVRRIASDNPWVLPLIGFLGVAATFVFAGLLPALVGFVLVLGIAVAALMNTVIRLNAAAAMPPEVPDDRAEESSQHESEVEAPEAGKTPSLDDDGNTPGPAPVVSDSGLLQAFDSASRNEVEETRVHVAAFIDDAKSETERFRRRCMADWILARAGDSGALARLTSLVETHPADGPPLYYLASTLDDLGEAKRGADEIAARVDRITDGKSNLLAFEARLRRKIGDSVGSLAAANKAFENAASDEERAQAFEEIGWAFFEGDEKLEAFAAFEQSLRLDPNRRDLRFSLAYRYDEESFVELAIYHYEVLLGNSPGTRWVHNNLGVAFVALGFLLHGLDHYRSAANLGESLAAANLANAFIEAGGRTEAAGWIEAGRSAVEVHQNIDAAAARLNSQNEEETRSLNEVRKRAISLREVIAALFLGSELPTGKWRLSDGNLYMFNVIDNESSFAEVGPHRQLRVTRQLSVLNVVWEQGQYSPSKRGLGYCDGSRLQFFVRDLPIALAMTAFVGVREE